jgi:hypothetical protein
MSAIGAKREKALQRVDEMPEGLRQCVHEYGLPIVTACVQAGVNNPRHIHTLVREIWDGARQTGQKNAAKGERIATQDVVDWLLIQSGSSLTAETLARALWERNLAIVPREPDAKMVEASMQTVSGFTEIVTKREKHSRRLKAAIEATVQNLWPCVFRDNKTTKLAAQIAELHRRYGLTQ